MAKNGLPAVLSCTSCASGRRARVHSEEHPQSIALSVQRRESECDHLHVRAGVLDGVKPAFQRMSGIDLVVPIGADQEKVLYIRLGQQRLDQVERCDVEPLQVVEEDRQRMFRPGENVDESPKYQLETPLRVLGRKLRDAGLFSDNESQLRDEIGDEPSVRAQRLLKGVAPAGQLGIALPRSGRIRL